MTDEFDDLDWDELEKPVAAGLVKPDVTVTLSVRNGRHTRKSADAPRVSARIVLRREAAEWIARHEPRFRVQIAGAGCNLLRIAPDAARGSYEAPEMRGVRILTLGRVNVWPNEIRREIAADWRVTQAGLVVILPADFARPGQGETPAAASAIGGGEPRPMRVATPAPAPLVRRALTLPGEPPPGRSALDQRRSKA
ncbi:hypothetical protein [Methylosinus sp. LW4]|uniref:hypothetical protein n=1 Tax=Methylosinus sp. LW4 TaxID=136993 RepID=UPI00035E5188|nr:hypothetical protein [Methylosinus sp. LW4]